jgi:hypothetical protein
MSSLNETALLLLELSKVFVKCSIFYSENLLTVKTKQLLRYYAVPEVMRKRD